MNAAFTLINTTKTTLGTASLVQYLQNKNIDISIIYAPKNNAELYTNEELELLGNEVKSSDIIGFSSLTICEKRTLQLMKYIKSKYNNKHLIIGGSNAIMNPQKILLEEGVDSICIHEGEIPLENLIKRYLTGSYFDILGLWFKVGDKIIKNDFQKPIGNIDNIPFINYKKNYKKLINSTLVKETNISENIENPCMPGNTIYVMASRGCPYSCSYCINYNLNKIINTTNSKIIRKRTNSKLISELFDIINIEKNINSVFFFDDDFFIRTENEIIDFCNEYKKIGLPFYVFANPITATFNKIKLCYSVGLKSIEFGLQTVSNKVLTKYNRIDSSHKIPDILKFVTDNNLDLKISIDFITNSPFETEEDVIENINYILQLDGDFTIYVHNLHLFPGSQLRQEYLNETNSEEFEYQDNVIERKIFNEYLSKILMAMQGTHLLTNPERYGTLNKKEIITLLQNKVIDYDKNIFLLNEKIKITEVAKYYSKMHPEKQN